MNLLARVALMPAAHLFGAAAGVRGLLYQNGILKTEKVDVPVISVGNITVGGTGKTAVVLELLHWCEQNGIPVGVVSRGYKRKSKGIAKVVIGPEAANLFGDEPTMIAQRFPHIPVYVGAHRIEAAKALLATHPQVKLILADDAFQHRALHRDLDVVLIDATEDIANYRLLPAGRAREYLSALKRAHYVILTKTNLVSSAQREKVLEIVKAHGAHSEALIECEYVVRLCEPVEGGQRAPLQASDRVFLLSGLGNPEAFRRTVASVAKVVGHSRFADHHDYTLQNIEDVLEEFAASQADFILTTEKDAVKLRQFDELHGKVKVAVLEPKLSREVQKLYDQISHFVR